MSGSSRAFTSSPVRAELDTSCATVFCTSSSSFSVCQRGADQCWRGRAGCHGASSPRAAPFGTRDSGTHAAPSESNTLQRHAGSRRSLPTWQRRGGQAAEQQQKQFLGSDENRVNSVIGAMPSAGQWACATHGVRPIAERAARHMPRDLNTLAFSVIAFTVRRSLPLLVRFSRDPLALAQNCSRVANSLTLVSLFPAPPWREPRLTWSANPQLL